MNESSLTGESVPVLKCALPKTQDYYSPTVQKKHTLYSGTEVLQQSPSHGEQNVCLVLFLVVLVLLSSFRVTNNAFLSKVYGVVCRTGFSTMKGELFHSMLFPKPIHFSFYTESYQFLGIMMAIGTLSFSPASLLCVFTLLMFFSLSLVYPPDFLFFSALASFAFSAWRLNTQGVTTLLFSLSLLHTLLLLLFHLDSWTPNRTQVFGSNNNCSASSTSSGFNHWDWFCFGQTSKARSVLHQPS
jgi:magnesium-transporting ATPase (P-type)